MGEFQRMSRSQSLLFKTTIISFLLLLAACGDDSGRAREPVTDASNYTELRLSSITFSVGGVSQPISPEFDSDTTGPYTVNVEDDVESIEITATRMNADTKLEIAKVEVALDDSGNPITGSDGLVIIDRLSEAVLVEDGQVDTKTIQEGDNRIAFRLSPKSSSNTFLNYIVNVHRVNTDAKLNGLGLRDRKGEVAELSPEFSPTTMEYSASVAYEDCMSFVRGLTGERHTELTIAGRDARHMESVPLELEVGANVIPIVSAAEDGVGVENYQLTITRAAGTAEQLAADATLKSASLTGADFSADFYCYMGSYTAGINQNVDSVQLTVTPSVEGATLQYGTPVFDTAGKVIDIEDGQTVVAGEAFDVGLEGDATLKALEVTATDGETKLFYQFAYARRATNWIEVESAEALQAALKNAQANDEIVLDGELFEGVASVDASGHAESHFYSDRSGTAENPIIVRSKNSTSPAALAGAGKNVNTVLRISGDYWVFTSLQFENAQNAIVLDAANNNLFDRIKVDGVGERGMLIQNGSSSNTVRRSTIANTGEAQVTVGNAEGIVVGSVADNWLGAPEGSEDEKVYDNDIRNNTFGPKVRAAAVRINEGSLRTQVQYNTVDVKGISSTGDNASAFVVKGNDANISYNTVYNDAGTGLNQVVITANVVRDWIIDAWGENLKYYQNIHSLGGAQIPLANSADVAVLNVSENTRADEIEVSYSGAGINESFTVPVYQIRTTVESALCFQEERPIPDFSLGETLLDKLSNVTVETCGEANEQKFKLVNDGDGYVFITTLDNPDRVVAPVHPQFVEQSSSEAVVVDIKEDLSNILPILNPAEGYYLRWQVLHYPEGVTFVNRGDWFSRFVLTGDTDVGSAVDVRINTGSQLQKFELVE